MDKMIMRILSSIIICSFFTIFCSLTICSPVIAQDHGEHQRTETGSGHQASSEHKDARPEPVNKAESEHKHVHVQPADNSSNDPAQENLFESVILDEKLGAKIPLDLSFVNENGQAVKLSDLVDRPVLLQLVFYHCPQSCNFMMANLASILESVTFTPGKDYRIVTVSFDHEDTPAIAFFYSHDRAARIYDGADEVHKTALAKRILRSYQGVKAK
ncbi:MAG: SCO family protein [Desulfamplus sp.]|nr:SCO family protein [Desulfamplus sp.]